MIEKLYENIKNRREEIGMSQEELAQKLGYKHRSSINKIELGINNIPTSKIKEFAVALKTTASSLMGWDEMDEKYNANGELSSRVRTFEKILTKLPLYNIPVSAGNGEWLDEGCEYEYVEFENASSNADYVLKVRGDSMEPMYSNGDIVFVKANLLVESGQVGIFVLNGEGFLKQLQGNRLVSLNSNYQPIIVEEWDSFFCAGKVIGKTSNLED